MKMFAAPISRAFMRANKLAIMVGALQLSGSTAVYAHSKWFMDHDEITPAPPVDFDHMHAAALVAVLACFCWGVAVTKAAANDPWLKRIFNDRLETVDHLDWRLLSFLFGTTLVVNSMMNVFVAPDLHLEHGILSKGMAFVQIIVGAMFILQSRVIIASLATFLLPVACLFVYSVGHSMDYAFELIGIGGALLLVAPILSVLDRDLRETALKQAPINVGFSVASPGRSFGWNSSLFTADGGGPHQAEWIEKRKVTAARFLRIMLGIQLIVLAAHDKLIDPSVSAAFVNKHSFINIPASLGFWEFTNLHFVVCAGFVEAALGLMLVLNIAIRPVCALLIAVFTITGIVFGGSELFGHLPIVGALAVIFVTGAGTKATADLPSVSFSIAQFKPAFGQLKLSFNDVSKGMEQVYGLILSRPAAIGNLTRHFSIAVRRGRRMLAGLRPARAS